ncbi:LOW QUALITY PROTEIN: KRAB-A domain-containing protein 2-like [Rhopalosiphum maidis]|uniref:LOW QUALITY PROTEIN: KRAB-A domain-containing protein 2-like n=1 Tax=Rhopalosiphum maidis TaxID=43146 RepID=UPI000F008747|nr:LOW QUALITY PROTEIN: KRAB-A domain-containing protein 2-like [Rhopalosiphum maidis]
MNVSNIEKLIVPVTDPNAIKYYVYNEEFYKIIHDVHLQTGHEGRNRMEHELNAKYKNITRECLMIYLNLCELCQRKGKTVKKGLVVTPIISSEMNSRCQVDWIDMQAQSDGNYRFILVYQDHLTKYVLLKSLTHKRAEEVAYILLDIFTTFGAPAFLQSNNGREFVNKVIEELCSMWEELKSQGSVERANQYIENMLATWLTDNKTNKWSEGLKFNQFMKNRSLHHGIKCSPYEAMFDTREKIGLKSTSLPENIIHKLKTDEDLETALNSINTTHEKKTKKQSKEKSVDTSSEENIDVNEEQADIIQSRQETIIEKRRESLHNLTVQASKIDFVKGKLAKVLKLEYLMLIKHGVICDPF